MSDLDIPQRFIDLAEQARGPRALSEEGLRERFGDPAEVEIEPGQVWHAHWGEISSLVLVLAIESREVRVAPVTVDPSAEDEHGLVVDASVTAFNVEATLWAGLTSTVPIRVLERLVDAWREDIVLWAAGAAEDRPGQVPAGTRLGHAIGSELEPAALLRAELADDLESLSQAPGLPVETPGAAPRTLASLLGDRLELASLVKSLALPQPEVMKLLRGKTPLSADQAEAVSRATRLPLEQVAGAVRPLPLDLVVTAEHPRWRSTWIAYARRLRTSEDQARLAAGYGAFALAARQTDSGEIDWDERLRQFLREEETGADGA